LKNGFHDRLLIVLLRPFFQILAHLATLIENGARSQSSLYPNFSRASPRLDQAS
jgi:hypothetical protein